MTIKEATKPMDGGPFMQIGGIPSAFTSATIVNLLQGLSHVSWHMLQLGNRWSIGLDVEVFGDCFGPLPSSKKIVADNGVAIIHINCDWNRTLIHNVPLIVTLLTQFYLLHIWGFLVWLGATGGTYRCHKVFIESPFHQPTKDRLIGDKKVPWEQRECWVDISPPDFHRTGSAWIGWQCVVY